MAYQKIFGLCVLAFLLMPALSASSLSDAEIAQNLALGLPAGTDPDLIETETTSNTTAAPIVIVGIAMNETSFQILAASAILVGLAAVVYYYFKVLKK